MIDKHIRRLQNLELLAEQKAKCRRSYEPFIVYRPWSFLLDQHYLIYYPEGLFKKPEKHGPMKHEYICDMLRKYPGNTRLTVSMGECSEWLFAFHCYSEHSKIYTAEQIDRFKEKELTEHPELAYLDTDAGVEDLTIMLQLPQSLTVKISEYLDSASSALK